MKPVVLFFARASHTEFCSGLISDSYDSIFVTLTEKEKNILVKKGIKVDGCFENAYDSLPEAIVPDNYFETSWLSDRFLSHRSLVTRIKILGKEITFWRNILAQYKPDVIVHETVAIEIAEVLYIEAKKINIPYCSFLLGNIIPNTFFWKPNPLNGLLPKHIFEEIDIDEESIVKAKKYLDDFRSSFSKPKYIQNSFSVSRYSIRRLKSYIISDTKDFIEKFYYQYLTKKFKYEIRLENFRHLKRYIVSIFYSYNKIEDIENKNYIFYPFHVEPEATLAYFSEFYSNQEHTIENIAKTLKSDQYLVVKEHPQQFGTLLLKRFRKLKKRIPSLIYLKAELPSERIINNAEAIITLTSNVGWEAMILGKPVLIMGNQYYADSFPVTKITSFSQIKEIVRNSKYVYPLEKELINSIAKFIKYLNEGLVIIYNDTDVEDNNRKMIKAIEKLLNNNRKLDNNKGDDSTAI